MRIRVSLIALGLAAALAAPSCKGAEQVKWDTYDPQLQASIDAAAATRDCAGLTALSLHAKATSHAHEKATGYSNDALVTYIEDAQRQAACP
jgi:hypothetical protein